MDLRRGTKCSLLLSLSANVRSSDDVIAYADPTNAAVPEGAAPALIGATVTTLIVGGGPLTGCGMNPARDLGPRIITMLSGWGGASFNPGFWIYTAGPLVGAVAGGTLYNVLLK